jgi:hypothetical protein
VPIAFFVQLSPKHFQYLIAVLELGAKLAPTPLAWQDRPRFGCIDSRRAASPVKDAHAQMFRVFRPKEKSFFELFVRRAQVTLYGAKSSWPAQCGDVVFAE